MGLLSRDQERQKIKEALRNAGKPLDHEQIADRAGLDPEETREAVSDLVDRGEVSSTLGWKYKLRR